MVEVTRDPNFHDAAREVVGLLTAAVDGMTLRDLIDHLDADEMEDVVVAFAVISAHVFVPATAHLLRHHRCVPHLEAQGPDVDSLLIKLGQIIESMASTIGEADRRG